MILTVLVDIGVVVHVIEAPDQGGARLIPVNWFRYSRHRYKGGLDRVPLACRVRSREFRDFLPVSVPWITFSSFPMRPDDDGRVVAVADNKPVKLADVFGAASHQPVFVEYQHPQAVAGFKQFAVSVGYGLYGKRCIHFFKFPDAVVLQAVGEGGHLHLHGPGDSKLP